MNYRETDDSWRLYRREWVIVHTVTMSGTDAAAPCLEAARAWAKENLDGRVRHEDLQFQLNTDLVSEFWCHVKVFKDNLKGEFKYVENAQQFARASGFDEYVIVPRNSKSDHDIRNYGVTLL